MNPWPVLIVLFYAFIIMAGTFIGLSLPWVIVAVLLGTVIGMAVGFVVFLSNMFRF
jgi:hypothetical protein